MVGNIIKRESASFTVQENSNTSGRISQREGPDSGVVAETTLFKGIIDRPVCHPYNPVATFGLIIYMLVNIRIIFGFDALLIH